MKKGLFGKVAILFGVAGLFWCIALVSVAAAAKGEYTFAFQSAWHTRHPIHYSIVDPSKVSEKFKKEQGLIPMWEKAASDLGYKIKFLYYPNSQLVKRKEAMTALKRGTIDILNGCPTFYHGMIPEGDIDWMPFTTTTVTRSEAWDFFHSGKIREIKSKNYLDKANAIWIGGVMGAGSAMLARGDKPFRSLEDMKGKKIRGAGGLATRVVDAFGASAVTMATGECYPALQRGIIDGLQFYVYGLRDYAFIDYCKGITYPPLYRWSVDYWMNAKKFKSLPKDLQEAFVKTGFEWSRWNSTEFWPKYEKELDNWAKAKGAVYYQLPEKELARWKEAVKPVWDWYAEGSEDCKREVEIVREWMK
ncbi:MAG: TRAP transporter substrate-binding protein DctP [Anaerolineales bacterium]|nr:TRAP transporter substrate-binding protein DctP [Anaerolineales bacterium]